jgi:hypothetical protein
MTGRPLKYPGLKLGAYIDNIINMNEKSPELLEKTTFGCRDYQRK